MIAINSLRVGVVVGLVGTSLSCGVPGVEEIKTSDLEGAAGAFRGNIAAIHSRDASSYLSYYLDSPDFVVAGGDTVARGFEAFAANRRSGDAWPDTLMAGEPTLVWLSPGVVYGAYPYTVVFPGADTSSGWSERVFLKVGGSWKIAVTSVIPRTETPEEN